VQYLKFLLITVFIFCLSTAKSIEITGIASSYKNESVIVFRYTDFITYKKEIIAKTSIDSNGFFKISFPFKGETDYIFIQINNIKGEFFVEKDTIYKIIIPPNPNPQLNDKFNYDLQPQEVIIKLEDSTSKNLHNSIQQFNEMYNYFVSKNYKYIRYRRDSLTKLFSNEIKKRFTDYNNPYFNQYVKYRLTMLQLYINQKHTSKMIDSTINHDPVSLNNIEYMDFLNNLLVKYTLSRNWNDTIKKMINQNHNYKDIISFIKTTDTLLFMKDIICEIIYIKHIYRGYYNKIYSRSEAIEALEIAKKYSSLKIINDISSRMINNIMFLAEGTQAPDIELIGYTSQPVRLSDFKNKYIYLSFFKTTYIPSQQEFPLLKNLYNKYKNDIVFISIFCDKDTSMMKNYISKYNPSWLTIHYSNTDDDIIEKYDIHSFPSFVLIGKDNKIINKYAPFPSQGIEKVFQKILNNR